MKNPMIIALFLSALLLPASEAGAQTSQASGNQAVSPDARRVKVGKTVYDFDEVDILGKLKRPEGQSVVEPPEFRFRRLLDLDESFLPNVVRSVDEF